MGSKTGIEWTDSTWNPLRGCSRVSEGCRNCYAESLAYRFSGEGQSFAGLAVLKNGHASWTGKVEFVEKHLLDPLKLRPVVEHRSGCAEKRSGQHRSCNCPTRPRRIFVNSVSDLFHEQVADEWLYEILAVVYAMPQHSFQALTKRASLMYERMTKICLKRLALTIDKQWRSSPGRDKDLLGPADFLRDIVWPLPNLWLGVSVENQAAAYERIPLLLQTPAAVRFLSAEPLLGKLQIAEYLPNALWNSIPSWKQPELDWVICGGESGPGARPMHPDWARSLRDQCAAAKVPFFMKQMGSVYGPKKGHKLPDDLNIKQFPEAAHGA